MRYSVDLADLEAKLAAPENRLLVLCNPNNPTGTIFPEETLREIARLSERYQVPVFSDGIFAEVVLEEGNQVTPYGKIAGEGPVHHMHVPGKVHEPHRRQSRQRADPESGPSGALCHTEICRPLRQHRPHAVRRSLRRLQRGRSGVRGSALRRDPAGTPR